MVIIAIIQGLKNGVQALFFVRNAYTKALKLARKNVHTIFKIPLISKIFERCFTEMFY